MTKKFLLIIIAAFAAMTSANAITRKALGTYAAGLNGLKKDALKTAVYKLITPTTVLNYGSGEGATWSGFYKTDRNSDNSCVDRYSNDVHYFTNTTSAISGMNIEHSFPKSWWGGTSNNAYKDLFNLMPCESKINSSKSNYGMGVVSSSSVDNGCTKVGKGTVASGTINLWEPADKWKGNFARGYMYMATAHQNLYSSYTGEGLNSLEKNIWPTLQQWAYTLYIKWGKEDKVSQTEVNRNDAVNAIQGNRNLFIDYPNLAEYIWGDSTNVAFNPSTSITTCSDDKRYGSFDPTSDGGGGSVTPSEAVTIYSIDFTQGQGDFTINNVSGYSSVWRQDNTYGMKAGAFVNNTNNASESWLISPEIDLTNYGNTELTFNEAVSKYFSDAATEATLWIKDGVNGTWQQLSYTHPEVTGNTSYSSFEDKTFDISDYDGSKIYLGFKYTSSTTSAGTWEIKNLKVTGRANDTAIDETSGFYFDKLQVSCSKAYNLAGQQVISGYKGIVIRGGKKILMK